MTRLDFSPLFRSTVGFDRVSRLLEAAMNENAGTAASYPPYNIEKLSDDAYRIVMAVAGFGEADIAVTVKENTLFVEGRVAGKDDGARYLHRGIAGAPSSAGSTSPTISRSRARRSKTACWSSTCAGKSRKR